MNEDNYNCDDADDKLFKTTTDSVSSFENDKQNSKNTYKNKNVIKYDEIFNKYIGDKLIYKNNLIIVNPLYPSITKEDIYAKLQLETNCFSRNFIARMETRVIINNKIVESFKPIDKSKISKEYDFIIEGTPLVKPSVGLIQGGTSSQKSLLIMSVLATISNGIEHPVLKGKVKHQNVLYFDYEQGACSTLNRIDLIDAGFGVKSDYPFFSETAEQQVPQFVAANYDKIVEIIKQTQSDLVVVDTYAAGCAATSEDDAAIVQPIMNLIKSISHATNTCIIIIHHKGKNSNNTITGSRGSTALPAAMDFIIDISTDTDENGFHKPIRHLGFPKDKNYLVKCKSRVDFEFKNDEQNTYLKLVVTDPKEKNHTAELINYLSDAKITEDKNADNIRKVLCIGYKPAKELIDMLLSLNIIKIVPDNGRKINYQLV